MSHDSVAADVTSLKFVPVTEVVTELGESPVWDDRRQCLFWCDIPNGRIWQMTPATGQVARFDLDGRVGSLGLCRSGRLAVACERRILMLDPDTGATRDLLLIDEDFAGRLNDGRVGPDGAFWVGSVPDLPLDRMPPVANLWRVTAQGARQVAGGIRCANGLAFNADGRWMMRSDSVGTWIARQQAETGGFGPAQILCTPGEAAGRPDGASFDIDNRYWSAGVSAGCLNLFDLDGQMLCKVPTPVPHPTMPCFGGTDFRSLYLTTHRKDMTDAALAVAPLSGRLLMARVDRPGFAAFRFNDEDLT